MRGGFGAVGSALSCVVLAAAGVAGCGSPSVGRRPVGAVSASVSAPAPAVGACYRTTTDTSARKVNLAGLTKVACGEPHVLETYHVGRFPAEVASRQSVPPADGPEARAAFADCEATAKDYLGDDWFIGRVHLVYSQATTAHWAAGGKYYRCDLAEVKSVDAREMAPRTSSVRDGLRGARPLASACYDYVNETRDTYDDLVPADCAGPHDVEFAGVFTAPGEAPPAADQQQAAGEAGCATVVAAYVGGTPDGMQVTALYLGYDPGDWARGDKRVRCYASKPEDRKLKGSVKGIGNRTPPTA